MHFLAATESNGARPLRELCYRAPPKIHLLKNAEYAFSLGFALYIFVRPSRRDRYTLTKTNAGI